MGTHEYTSVLQRAEQLEQHLLDVNQEFGTLQEIYRTVRREFEALEAQNDALKSHCTDLESQHRHVLRINIDLQKKHDAASNDAQKWRESCKKAQADALAVRKEKETQDKAMAELMERERVFRHRTHVNKMAVSVHSCKETL